MAVVHHFTDTARLPWILQSGELRPGLARPEGWPADFLWATKLPHLDGTSSAMASVGSFPIPSAIRAVRISLPSSAFIRWSDVPARFPEWGRDHVEGLEWYARGKSRPRDWMVRPDPLPCDQWLAVHTRGHTDPQWFPLDIDGALFKVDDDVLGVTIDGFVYASRRETNPDGRPRCTPQGTPIYSPRSVLPHWEMVLSRHQVERRPVGEVSR